VKLQGRGKLPGIMFLTREETPKAKRFAAVVRLSVLSPKFYAEPVG
jgi:hypothetical protein